MSTVALLCLCLFAADPSTITQDAKKAREAFARGSMAFETGDFPAAIESFTIAAGLVPDWALAHLQLGIAQRTLDQGDAAGLASLERAVALDATNARARLELGLAYAHMHKYDEALSELMAARKLRPRMPEIIFAYAETLAKSGKLDAAIEAYYDLLARSPGHVGALLGLATSFERQGLIERAEAAWLTLTRLYYKVAYHRYRLAEFYERVGRPEDAARVFSALEKQRPRKRKMRELR